MKKWEEAKKVLSVNPRSSSHVFFSSQDLVSATEFDPTSADVKAALTNVQRELDAQVAREKQLYSKMFG